MEHRQARVAKGKNAKTCSNRFPSGEPDPADHAVGRGSGLFPDHPVEEPTRKPGLPEDRTEDDGPPDLGEIDVAAGLRRQRVGFGAFDAYA